MFSAPKKPKSYSGAASYALVEPILRRGARLMIASPYLDLHYAEFLATKTSAKRVYILSSSISSKASERLQRGKSYLSIVALGFAMTLVSLASFLSLHMQYLSFLAAATALLAFIISYLRFHSPSRMIIKSPKHFVHAKMYINEKKAAYGSANLTFAGMHKNLEHIHVVEAKERNELERQFWVLWRSS